MLVDLIMEVELEVFQFTKKNLFPTIIIILMDVLIPIYVLAIIHDIFLQLTIMLVPQLFSLIKSENNFIKEKICAIHHTGLGPDLLKRQTGPHCHYVGITPDKEFVYAVDLGADKVIMYTYQDGKLEEDVEHTLNVVPGSGPRHMIFSKDGRFAYLVNEISNNLMVYKYNDKYLNLIQVIHTTPRHFHGFSSASAIRLSATGNHLFISNRGHDSIVLYRVNQETGKVSLLYMVHTGKNPRDFNIIDDKYLIVGAQDDDELELLTFDEKSEQLVRTASTLAIPAPVCIAINKEK